MKKKIITTALIIAAIFGGIRINNATVFNPSSKLEVDLSQLSYYGQYNSYNNSFRTNYVRPYIRSNGTYVNGYYRS